VKSVQVSEDSWVVTAQPRLGVYQFADLEHVHHGWEPGHVLHALDAQVVELHHGKLEPLAVRVDPLHSHRFCQNSSHILNKEIDGSHYYEINKAIEREIKIHATIILSQDFRNTLLNLYFILFFFLNLEVNLKRKIFHWDKITSCFSLARATAVIKELVKVLPWIWVSLTGIPVKLVVLVSLKWKTALWTCLEAGIPEKVTFWLKFKTAKYNFTDDFGVFVEVILGKRHNRVQGRNIRQLQVGGRGWVGERFQRIFPANDHSWSDVVSDEFSTMVQKCPEMGLPHN